MRKEGENGEDEEKKRMREVDEFGNEIEEEKRMKCEDDDCKKRMRK